MIQARRDFIGAMIGGLLSFFLPKSALPLSYRGIPVSYVKTQTFRSMPAGYIYGFSRESLDQQIGNLCDNMNKTSFSLKRIFVHHNDNIYSLSVLLN